MSSSSNECRAPPSIADPMQGDEIDLEGNKLVVVQVGHTDTDDTTCLHVPSIGLVAAGDAVYTLATEQLNSVLV
jgi:hypothetical protein